MKPYGREKHVSGGNNWKIDLHIRPKRKFSNWWEDICQLLPRSTMKAKSKKEIKEELLKSLQSMNKLITRILDVILNRCQKCHKPLAIIRDWSGGVEGYGLYYCSDCNDIKE